jgi:UDPglucose 6-dehydrogenase
LKISVVGGGYVGLVTASCFVDLGHNVRIIEIDDKKVSLMNAGIPPIYEDKLGGCPRTVTKKRIFL